MSWHDNILEFVTDRSKRLSARATIVVLTIFSLVFIDNIIGFSHYYSRQRQLEQLKDISVLLRDSSLSKKSHENLLVLEQQTFDRKNVIDYSLAFFKNISLTSSKKNPTSATGNDKNARSNIWFLISTSGFYILITIFVVPVLLLTDKKTPFFKLLATMLIFIIVMIFTSWFIFWLLDKLIPDRLFGSWVWNYIINFLIQIGLVIGLTWTTNTINKANK